MADNLSAIRDQVYQHRGSRVFYRAANGRRKAEARQGVITVCLTSRSGVPTPAKLDSGNQAESTGAGRSRTVTGAGAAPGQQGATAAGFGGTARGQWLGLDPASHHQMFNRSRHDIWVETSQTGNISH